MRPGTTPIRLIFVSAGLSLAGGGRASAARMLAAGSARYAARHGMGFEVFSLGSADEPEFASATRHFDGHRSRLAVAVLRAQRRRHCALIFDLLGLARIEAPLPTLARPPYMVVLYGIDVWQPLSAAHRRALHGAAVQAAISNYTLTRAQPYVGRLSEAAIVPLTLEDTLSSSPERGDAALLAALGRGYLLIVGRMSRSERYKGHEILLEAMARLPEARLVVVGDGDDRPRLQELAVSLGLGERVFFTGYVATAVLPEIYRRASVFVMPSTGEGFGLVYLEAMREGVPCIAAQGTVAEEVMANGDAGLLVPAGDAAALAEACGRLLDDPELAHRLGAAGAQRFRREFSPARFENAVENALDRLLTHVRN